MDQDPLTAATATWTDDEEGWVTEFQYPVPKA